MLPFAWEYHAKPLGNAARLRIHRERPSDRLPSVSTITPENASELEEPTSPCSMTYTPPSSDTLYSPSTPTYSPVSPASPIQSIRSQSPVDWECHERSLEDESSRREEEFSLQSLETQCDDNDVLDDVYDARDPEIVDTVLGILMEARGPKRLWNSNLEFM